MSWSGIVVDCRDNAPGSNASAADLTIRDTSFAPPKRGQVLIKVAAAGINRPDILQRRGLYPPPKGASPIMGLEVAGTIVACGKGVTAWREGDEVCALLAGGGYASYAYADSALCLPIPAGVTLIEAAGLPEATATVWFNLMQQARLKSGDRVLIHGGASGIGTMAIQLCRAYGATVIASASASKHALCLTLGAKAVYAYQSPSYWDDLRHAAPFAIILDIIGGSTTAHNLALLQHGGRLQTIALQESKIATIDLSLMMRGQLRLSGSMLRPQTKKVKAKIIRDVQRYVWPLFTSRTIRPVIDSTYPITAATAAQEKMLAGIHSGKIILTLP